MKFDINKFSSYCQNRNWRFDKFSSEFTFQFRICRYIESIKKTSNIELESNIEKYSLYNLTKKEIDIELTHLSRKRTAIEIKYIRDAGSHNIGMFNYCEDIKFLEELTESCFSNGLAILFTTIDKLYTPPKKEMKPKNIANLELYNAFRVNGSLSGILSLQTGEINKTITLKGEYKLNWVKFDKNIMACVVEVNNTQLKNKNTLTKKT